MWRDENQGLIFWGGSISLSTHATFCASQLSFISKVAATDLCVVPSLLFLLTVIEF